MVREYKDIEPVPVPPEWATWVNLEREEGTRWYVDRGHFVHLRDWFEDLKKAQFGVLIPLPWVAEYVGVSRAAVHQRAKNGGLTVFSYIVMEKKRTILGGKWVWAAKQRYDLVPVKECTQWQELLEERADEIAEATGREPKEKEVLESDQRKLKRFKGKKGGE